MTLSCRMADFNPHYRSHAVFKSREKSQGFFDHPNSDYQTQIFPMNAAEKAVTAHAGVSEKA